MDLHLGRSLRDYLELLEGNDLLIRVDREVERDREIPSILFRLVNAGRAVIFSKVKGSAFPVVGNLVVSRKMLGLALGCDPRYIAQTWNSRCTTPLQPELVSDGPVKEVIEIGRRADLTTLPIVTHAEKDAGPYITAGVVIAKDPDTGKRNLSFNRMLLLSSQELAIRSMPPQQLGILRAKAEGKGEGLPAAVVIGLHPIELLAAATSLEMGHDELEVAGALRGRPVSLLKCETIDVEVPAEAEIVLEGEILPHRRVPEAPFGDFMQFYMPQVQSPVFRLKAILRRRDAIYHTIHAGTNDDMHLLAPSREAMLLDALTRAGIEVVAISLLPTILGCAVAIRKRQEGEAINAGLVVLGAYRWAKTCIVVDYDVDVLDQADLLWALSTRCRPETGILVVPNAAGFPRDARRMHQSKVIIDATVPVGAWEEFERRRPPGIETVRLEEFIPEKWWFLIQQ